MNQNTPVIVGIHQFTQRWQDATVPLEPLMMMAKASQEAIEDTRVDFKKIIDTVYVVNIFSYTYQDAPNELAQVLEINPNQTLYPTEGGNTPQYLIGKACLALEKGESKGVLIAGAEAVYGFKQAQKKGIKLDWKPRKQPQKIDGEIRVPLNEVESAYELYLPANIYPLFETAIRANAQRSPEAHHVYLGKLYEHFANVAAQNPHAWSQDSYSPEEIYQISEDNRYITYPYTKRMNANINVDQAAALLLTTVGEAQKLGISEDKWVFPSGSACLNEVWEVTRRPKLHESVAIREAGKLALAQAGLGISAIDAFDLYSCFPCAVQMAQKALGIDENDPRPLTLTGGLSYFGGPGNNYVSHSIVTAVEQIRQNPTQKLLLTALGWYATKHAVGVYSKNPPLLTWQESQDFEAKQAEIDATALPAPTKEANGRLTIEAYAVIFGRNQQPEKGVVIGKLEDGTRTVAYLEADTATLSQYCDTELVGKQGTVHYRPDKKRNWVIIDDTK